MSMTITALEQASTNLRDRLLVGLLFHSGCRISEALALEVSDVELLTPALSEFSI